MATKQPNKWWNNDDAFPRRTLRIYLLAPRTRTRMAKVAARSTVRRNAVRISGQFASSFAMLAAVKFPTPIRSKVAVGDVVVRYLAEAIRSWLIRSLLKPSGIWGSGLGTLLTALRDARRVELHQSPAAAGGKPDEDVASVSGRANQLPNLQLLQSEFNIRF